MSQDTEKRTAAVHNLGCKVNGYESEAMVRMFLDAGYRIVPFEQKADVYLINTCCVTQVAEKKSRQMIHRARKSNPEAVVIAVGCYSQIAAEELLEDGSADIIIGADGKKEIIRILDSGQRGIISRDDAKDCYEELPSGTDRMHTRGFIKVEDGCDNFCTYCIIPYARGRVRSRAKESILDEIRTLADDGCLEIVISGVNLSSYGKDLCSPNALEGLIKEAASVPGIERIRLGSLEPVVITESFLDAAAESGKVCPHFHLSLQSGCGKTLRAMNRRYTPEEYEEKCRMIRSRFREPSLTTDLIAGFPGETEADFLESWSFVRSIGFFETHVFPYSAREGTKAARMEGQVLPEVKKERVRKYLELDRKSHASYLEGRIGSTVRVLIEEQERIGVRVFETGHTERYEKVLVPGTGGSAGKIRTVTAAGTGTDASGSLCLLASK